MEIIVGKNILNPNDYTILSETVDMGNFYGEPFERRYILLDVDTTIDYLDNPISFVFSNDINKELYWIIKVLRFGVHKINKIHIYETDQLKRELSEEEKENGVSFEYFTFSELTNGILI